MTAHDADRCGPRSETDWAGIAFGVSLASLAAYQQFKLPPVLPLLLDHYGYDRALAGSFMSIYAVAGLLFSMPIGRWLARHGVSRGVAVASLIMIAGNLLSLLAPQQGWLMLAGRGLEGFSFAFGALLGPAIAGSCASPRHRHFAIALASAWIPIGQIVAGLGAPLALTEGRWQELWIAGILATAALWLWGLTLARRGTFSLRNDDRRMVEPRLSRRELEALLIAGAIFLLWSGQYYAYMTWLPQYLIEARALGPVAATFGYLLPVVVLMGFNLVTGEILRRGMAVTLLLLLGVASQALSWWLTPLAHSNGAGIALLIFYGIGAGITPTCLFALPGATLGRVAGPHAFAIIMTGRNVGVLLGPVLLALLQQRYGGWDAVAPALAVATTVAMLGALLLHARYRRNARAVPASR